ncbi:hypothetical protein MRX96_027634 [Rhipicephalus microplus]
MCKADIKIDINEHNIAFCRAQIVHRGWRFREYNGTFRYFDQKSLYDSVRIQSKDRRNMEREILIYQSKNNSCAVFWILSSKGYQLTPFYDLRIKDSYIEKEFPRKDGMREVLITRFMMLGGVREELTCPLLGSFSCCVSVAVVSARSFFVFRLLTTFQSVLPAAKPASSYAAISCSSDLIEPPGIACESSAELSISLVVYAIPVSPPCLATPTKGEA